MRMSDTSSYCVLSRAWTRWYQYLRNSNSERDVPERGDRRKSESDRRSYFGLSRFYFMRNVIDERLVRFVDRLRWPVYRSSEHSMEKKWLLSVCTRVLIEHHLQYLFRHRSERIQRLISLVLFFIHYLLDANCNLNINHSAVYINPFFCNIES